MKRLILASAALFSLVVSTAYAQPTGDQDVKVLAATRTTTPYMTLQQIATKAAFIATVWRGTSYGTYRPVIVGPSAFYYVPTERCSNLNADGAVRTSYVDAVIRQAMDSGVVIEANDLVLVNWDCGHSELIVWSTVLGRNVMASDGKIYNTLMGQLRGLLISLATNTPPKSVNNFDNFTPMGYNDNNHQYNSAERKQLGYIGPALVLDDWHGAPSSGTHFIESLERPPTGALKQWRLSLLPHIEVREFNPSRPPVVHLYRSNSVLDLDPLTACYQYELPVGQIYKIAGFAGSSLGVRVDSIEHTAARSGAWISVFPYSGPSTVTCQGGGPK